VSTLETNEDGVIILDEDVLDSLPLQLRAEIVENIDRKSFTQSELAEIQGMLITRLSSPEFQRRGRRSQAQIDADAAAGIVYERPKRFENVTEKVAKLFGESEMTVRKRLAVAQAAKDDPEHYAGVSTNLDTFGSVHGAYRRLKEEQMKAAIAGEEHPLVGKYRTLIIDPPWPIEKLMLQKMPGQDAMPYATMTLEEIRALPVADLVHPDGCHLYLWTTHKHLPAALGIMSAWGFKYLCVLTWIKNQGFTPFSFMFSTEHVLFGHVGHVPFLKIGARLDFAEARREHSRKPEIFYNLARTVSPGPRLDMFAREGHEGFETWGAEAGKFGGERPDDLDMLVETPSGDVT